MISYNAQKNCKRLDDFEVDADSVQAGEKEVSL